MWKRTKEEVADSASHSKIAKLKGLLKACPYGLLCLIFTLGFWGVQISSDAVTISSVLPFLGSATVNESKSVGISQSTTNDSGPSSLSTSGNASFSQAESSDVVSGDAEQNQPEAQPIDTDVYPYCLGEVDHNSVIYSPVATDSRFYTDSGEVALNTLANYSPADEDYFQDAAFIGDSRMVGIADYSGFQGADYFCENGYCVYNYSQGEVLTCQNTGSQGRLQDFMSAKQYGKIYIMMGTNDCGYLDFESFRQEYQSMVEMIEEKQPNAVIFLLSNLHVTRSGEGQDTTGVYNNISINSKNLAISQLADGQRTFYLDINPQFVDTAGYLIDDYTFDGFHLYAQQYTELADFLKAHSISQ